MSNFCSENRNEKGMGRRVIHPRIWNSKHACLELQTLVLDLGTNIGDRED